MNKILWNLKRNSYIFIQENTVLHGDVYMLLDDMPTQ